MAFQNSSHSQGLPLQTPFLTEERIQKFKNVVTKRTYNVLPVVEGLYDMGNLSATCRSADAFGLGAVHAVNLSDQKCEFPEFPESFLEVSVS